MVRSEKLRETKVQIEILYELVLSKPNKRQTGTFTAGRPTC